MTGIDIALDGFPSDGEMQALSAAAWGRPDASQYGGVLARSLCHVTARDDEGRLVGFVNVAWDGGIHAFLLDTMVHPDHRRRGIATRLVATATDAARLRGAVWLHVDCEPHLEGFYRGCGFEPTRAGLIRLAAG